MDLDQQTLGNLPSGLPVYERADFLLPIQAVLDSYQQYLDQRPWKSTTALKRELAQARARLDLLVNTAVALKNQEEPGLELLLTQERARTQELRELCAHLRHEISQMVLKTEVEVLSEQVKGLQRALNNSELLVRKLAGRLSKTRDKVRSLKQTLVGWEVWGNRVKRVVDSGLPE